jgi:hypothetical protein
MKYLRFYITGTILVLLLQVGVLLFLDKMYFNDNASYSAKQITDNQGKPKVKPKVYLEAGHNSIANSNDGKYVSYLMNNTLHLLNLENGEKLQLPSEKGATISNYRWVYDRSRIIIAEKFMDKSTSGYFKLYYYDVDNKEKVEIFNSVNEKSIKIQASSSTEKVSEIELSTLTNVIYLKTIDSKNLSSLYRINIMAQQNKVNTVTRNISNIISLKKDETILYENSSNGKIYKNESTTPVEVEGKTSFKLLAIDDNDTIYLALMENNKAKSIYHGILSNKTWEKHPLKGDVDVNNIFVSNKGQVFINDKTKSILTEVDTNKETSYSGNIIGISNDSVISEKDTEIISTVFKQ